MENGFVRLPIEKYNALLLENAKLKLAFKMVPSYNNTELSVQIEPHILEELIVEIYERSTYTDDYTLSDPGSWWTQAVSVGKRKATENETND